MGLRLKQLPQDEALNEGPTERRNTPAVFYSFVGRIKPSPSSDFLPLLPARWLSAFERATGRSRTGHSLVRVAHGWYATRRLTTIETLRAVMRIVPGDTVVAGETAGLLWGVDVRPTSAFGKPFNLCVARPEGARALRRPGLRCRVVRFEKGDQVRRLGVRCTSALRTALDMAASSSLDVATHIFEVFLRQGLVTFGQLRERIALLGGTRGVTVLRAAIDLAHPGSESVFETATRLRLIEAGLPAPTPQIPIRVPGRKNALRVDLGWEELEGKLVRVAAECDSDTWHPLAGPKAEADRVRRQRIRGQGWRVLSIRFHMLRGLEPNFEVELARLLGVQLRVKERRRWSLSKWNLQRNAWVRSEERQLRAATRSRFSSETMRLVVLA